MARIWWPAIVGLIALSVGAFGQREAARETKPVGERYRVTAWPVEDPEREDTREVEAHLNRMAAEGWRFHGQITAHRSHMLVFERVSRERDRAETEPTAGSDR